jgi:hypothetical protein
MASTVEYLDLVVWCGIALSLGRLLGMLIVQIVLMVYLPSLWSGK